MCCSKQSLINSSLLSVKYSIMIDKEIFGRTGINSTTGAADVGDEPVEAIV